MSLHWALMSEGIFSHIVAYTMYIFLKSLIKIREIFLTNLKKITLVWLWNYCLFVLRFYGPVNPMGSCRAYGKCPKILNTLKFRTPNIFAQNHFWKCPKISNSSSFAKRGFLKFRTQLSPSNFLSANSNFGNVFFFFFVTEPEIKVVMLKATAKHNAHSSVITNFMYINGMGTIF